MSGLQMEAWCIAGLLALMIGFAMLMAKRATSEKLYRHALLAERDEFAMYARLDTTASDGDLKPLARRVCAAVAQHSPCRQVALLLRGTDGGLRMLGSAGVDLSLEAALTEWGARFQREQWFEPSAEPQGSYRVTLGPMETFDTPERFGTLQCRHVMMLPLRSGSGSGELVLGMLMVAPAPGQKVDMQRAMPPIEALAGNVARSLELLVLEQRLLGAEEALEEAEEALKDVETRNVRPATMHVERSRQCFPGALTATERDVPLMAAS